MPDPHPPGPPSPPTPLAEGVDFTVEDGRWVFTALYLRNRGYCCTSGCRNCPYKDGPSSLDSDGHDPTP